MNAISHVETALARFLETKETGVLAVKGAWGVGKTYLWNHFVAKQAKVEGCRAYAYVSLFGITSIAELRRAIFTKLSPLGEEKKGAGWFAKWGSTATRHIDVQIPFVGIKNTELWADAIEQRALKGILVCLDDLERKDENMPTSALLGFIASLRDERGCKVVLLYNEERAQSIDSIQSALAEYREKVIDREVVLQPTVRECYDLIFSGTPYQFADDETGSLNPFFVADKRSLLALFETMGLANIRVMQKVRLALDYLATEIADKYPKHWPTVARQTTKLAWMHYCYAKAFPIEDVADHTRWLGIYARRDQDEGNSERAKYAPVERIAYHTQPSDALIVDYLRHGYVDWANYTPLLQAQETERRRLELGAQLHANWDLVWDNFQAPEEEFRERQMKFLREHHATMGLSEVSQVVRFLETLAPNPEAAAILAAKIEAFVQANAETDPFDLTLHALDADLAKEILQKLHDVPVSKALPEAISMLTRDGGWNPRDLRYLAGYQKADFLAWLTTDTSSRLLNRLKTFRERFAGDPAGKPIVDGLDAALHEIAQRSPLDAKRVYGAVGVPKPTPPTNSA